MSAYDRKLYNNLPLYARLADEEGILRHICDVIQVEIDKNFTSLYKRQFLLDAESAPDEWMQFLGQLVALSPQGQNYLGTGVNPEWSTAQKRTLLLNAWKYWQKKGTPQGIREAIWLWLGWESALDPTKLHILQPFGDRPVAKPDNWFSWGSLYHENLLRTYQEKSFLGAEQIIKYSPNYLISDTKENPVWYRPENRTSLSCLGPGNLWLHLILGQEEWTSVLPNTPKLLQEAAPTGRKPSVFGWLRADDFPDPITINAEGTTEKVQELRVDGFKWGILTDVDFTWGGTVLPSEVIENSEVFYQSSDNQSWTTKKVVYFKETIAAKWIDGDIFNYSSVLVSASDAKNWFLHLEGEENVYRLPAVTIFWYKDEGENQRRSFHFSLAEGFTNLFVEFLFTPQKTDYISKASLKLQENLVQELPFTVPIPIGTEFNAGFQFFVPFRLPSGKSLNELLFIAYWLPILKVYKIRLDLLIEGDPMARLIAIPLPPTVEGEQAVLEFEQVLQDITQQLDILIGGYGDKHFEYTISEPTLSLVIQHNLGKQPAVDFIDHIDGIGADAIAEVNRIDENSIEIKFSQQRTGVVIFN